MKRFCLYGNPRWKIKEPDKSRKAAEMLSSAAVILSAFLQVNCSLGCFHNLLKHRFVNTAYRAYPVVRQIGKSRTGSYAMFRIAFLGIVSVTAGIAKIFVHNDFSLSFVFYYLS